MNNLIISGRSGVGKSSIILNSLSKSHYSCGGFTVRRIFNAENSPIAFALIPPFSTYEYTINSPEIFLKSTENKWEKNLSIFETIGTEYLKNTENNHIMLLDEIGGIELSTTLFMTELKKLILSPTPCIAVLKGVKNAHTMSTTTVLSNDYINKYNTFTYWLNKYNIEIHELTENNHKEITNLIDSFVSSAGEGYDKK